MRPTCVFTVDSARWNRSAISALFQPRPIAVSTSRSRSVSTSNCSAAAAPSGSPSTGNWSANRSSSRRVSFGATTASPFATTLIPASSSSGWASFTRNPLAPARSAAYAYSSRSNVVSTSTRLRPPAAMIRRVASIPSTPGIRTSMSTTSGPNSVARRTASAPLSASPSTTRSGWLSTSIRNPMRCNG